jgi:hypothetical protein
MRATSSNAVFQHLRSSSRVSAVVFQHLCFSMFHFCVAASVFAFVLQHLCLLVFAFNSRVSATTFSAFVIQHLCFSTYVSLLCCSICVRICVAVSVFAFNSRVSATTFSAFVFQYLRFTFVLQQLFSHLCCNSSHLCCGSLHLYCSVFQHLFFKNNRLPSMTTLIITSSHISNSIITIVAKALELTFNHFFPC